MEDKFMFAFDAENKIYLILSDKYYILYTIN